MGRAPLTALLAAAVACGGERTACVTIDPGCAPLYEPTWANVLERTLRPSCALPGGACHASAGGQGGLVVDGDALAVHTALTAGARPRVVAGNAGCSELVRRVTSGDPQVVMPRGKPLGAAEQCAVVRWVAEGARP